jgi:catechol 2,3-dioxygenase-like lactoylglutathione lyase family enzyme
MRYLHTMLRVRDLDAALEASDRLLLCGEGLSEVFTHENLERLATSGVPIEKEGEGLGAESVSLTHLSVEHPNAAAAEFRLD